MIMVADAVPECKRFLKPAQVSESVKQMLLRMLAAFVLHSGRMSCLQAAGAIRSAPRHRAQVSRFLARPRWQNAHIDALLREIMLANERAKGDWVFIIDATLCGQAGKKTENTYSTGNRQRRPQQGRRYGKYKHANKSCHCFTAGLLITPSGVRIPFSAGSPSLEELAAPPRNPTRVTHVAATNGWWSMGGPIFASFQSRSSLENENV